MRSIPPIKFEFHVSRIARELYQFDQALYSLRGDVIFVDFSAARRFVEKINHRRDVKHYPDRAVKASEINTLALLHEISHLVIRQYQYQNKFPVMEQALTWLEEKLGTRAVENTLMQFVKEFPPLVVHNALASPEEFLADSMRHGEEEPVDNHQVILEEVLLLWLANVNPAASPMVELFDDKGLEDETAYPQILTGLYAFFENQAPFGREKQNLIDLLRSPAIAVPGSLVGQLEYIRAHWGYLVGDLVEKLMASLDLFKEEGKPVFGTGGEAASLVYSFAGLEGEVERFSRDLDWMPRMVLLAKNVYVWLDQLSRKYHRSITHLDQIPDEELRLLRGWGFTGLWLIGLWERSPASRKIKQLMGNPEAVASAYSLFSYDIAEDLGGENAFQEFRQRTWQAGIRLASDMVPNHMGIDSRWVIEHPDWFIALNQSPFPGYRFSGPNLSWDDRVGIYLDDHYYDHSDAAVVFKRVDLWTGAERYIYHGNDGTAMPWNDTAQLNYLIPEVREAVIQTILHVARKFPIIRFDAAMTLAKRHYQRLWFPEPGLGGDIPSRAGLGLSRSAFDQVMPEEFWREVVERVSREVPDTLLLAEAFWLMEGYFVRSLGMHRVYNSAFMNMLRDEKNQEYRLVIKNTLEFDPEILKRYVNFMNNPDERTAVDQFGKGDKYFGICILLATLPGLPMFGHGQVEGYAEKYGMEFKKALWMEEIDSALVERHEKDIFPLLQKRYLFAEARDFLLYDFFLADRMVNEDVFAYSNRAGNERSLVVYHNRYASTAGWIRQSAAFRIKNNLGEGGELVQKTLVDGLGLRDEDGCFTVFRDHASGLEYIRSNREMHEKGLYLELGPFQYYVFVDIFEVKERYEGEYSRLAGHLNGRGVSRVEAARRELQLQPVHAAFDGLYSEEWMNSFLALMEEPLRGGYKTQKTYREAVLDQAQVKVGAILEAVESTTGVSLDKPATVERFRKELTTILVFPWQMTKWSRLLGFTEEQTTPGFQRDTSSEERIVSFVFQGLPGRRDTGFPIRDVGAKLLFWLGFQNMGFWFPDQDPDRSRRFIEDDLLMKKPITNALVRIGLSAPTAREFASLLIAMCSNANWWRAQERDKLHAKQVLRYWMKDQNLRSFLKVHQYQEKTWFNKEAFEEFMWWMNFIAFYDLVKEMVLGTKGKKKVTDEKLISIRKSLKEWYELVDEILKIETSSGYQLDRLLE